MSSPVVRIVQARNAGSEKESQFAGPSKIEVMAQDEIEIVGGSQGDIKMVEEGEEEQGIMETSVKQQKHEGSQVNVQIITPGKAGANGAKGEEVTQEYLIIEQPSQSMDGDESLLTEEDMGSQHGTGDGDSIRHSVKKPQKYRQQWEAHPSLKDWLTAISGNPYRAWCKLCACPLIAQLKVLLDHSRCRKHLRRHGRPPQEPPAGGVGNKLSMLVSSPWNAGSKDCTSDPLDVSYGDQDRVTYSIGLGNQKIGFIGAGKIAQAIAMGMMNKGLTSSTCVFVSAPTDHNLPVWKRWRCKTVHNNSTLVRNCDVIFVCVSAADLETVVVNLEAPGDGWERCFISTVAGVTHEKLTQMMNEVMPDEQVHIVRCVPSRTVAIGEGVTVYCAAADLPHTWLLTMETIFSALGLCHKVDESVMNVHSGAFSSGPAYAAAFIDALAAGAANHGVRWEDAIQMAAQVTKGTAQLILTQGMTPANIRREVCSAGGNTLAGMMALHKAGMEFAVMSAVDEATKKAKHLGADAHL